MPTLKLGPTHMLGQRHHSMVQIEKAPQLESYEHKASDKPVKRKKDEDAFSHDL